MGQKGRAPLASASCGLAGLLLLLAAGSQPRGSDALGVEQDEREYISDVDRFPGWKGTLPGSKGGEFSGDPNRVRTVASGSLGQARARILCT